MHNRALSALAALLLAGCTAPTTPAPGLANIADDPAGCPELTDMPAYAYFCDSQGGISLCEATVNGREEPSMCDQATTAAHQCSCDSLATCQGYRDGHGYAAVGCVTGAQEGEVGQ